MDEKSQGNQEVPKQENKKETDQQETQNEVDLPEDVPKMAYTSSATAVQNTLSELDKKIKRLESIRAQSKIERENRKVERVASQNRISNGLAGLGISRNSSLVSNISTSKFGTASMPTKTKDGKDIDSLFDDYIPASQRTQPSIPITRPRKQSSHKSWKRDGVRA